MERDELLESLATTAAAQCDSLIRSNMAFAVDALAQMVKDAPADAHKKGVTVTLKVHLTKRAGNGIDVTTTLGGKSERKWADATEPEAVGTDQPELPGVGE